MEFRNIRDRPYPSTKLLVTQNTKEQYGNYMYKDLVLFTVHKNPLFLVQSIVQHIYQVMMTHNYINFISFDPTSITPFSTNRLLVQHSTHQTTARTETKHQSTSIQTHKHHSE